MKKVNKDTKVTSVDHIVYDNDFFYRDQEMFRSDMDLWSMNDNVNTEEDTH